MAKELGLAHLQEEAFIAGLLHDIGKVILNVQDRAKFIETLKLSLEQGLNSVEAERRIFGIDHTEVGNAAAEAWKLPELLVYAIAHHEKFSNAAPKNEYEHIQLIVQYADAVAKKSGFGIYRAEVDYRCAQLAELLGLTAEQRDANEKRQKERLEADPFFRFCTGLVA